MGTNGNFDVTNGTNDFVLRYNGSSSPYVQIGDGNVVSQRALNITADNGTAGINIQSHFNSGFSAFSKLQFYHSRGTSSSPSAIHNSETLGLLYWYGRGTSTYENLAEIGAISESYIGEGGSGAYTTNNLSGSFVIAGTNLGTNNQIIHLNGDGSVVIPNGSLYEPITSKSSSYTATIQDHTIIVTATATITLPAAADVRAGKTYVIKHNGFVGTVTIDGNLSETIDGAATQLLSSANAYMKIITDGSNWFIVGQ
ncbi:MAG: hypothetical protein SchgKO_23910 [Schleiferiaceae bacterium]